MFRSLDDLRVLLGVPAYRSIVGERPDDVRAAAHWQCGCNAVGPSFGRMALKTCASHRAGRIGVPVTA
ncbi:MAG TPA: hypothetical protein VHT53_02165 [Candidatus Elarobacter sp.]|nr:hypothetical protein [Candidatus Elarobacter sp.]